jgi:hypothetical protein
MALVAESPMETYVTAIRITVQDGAQVAFTTAYPVDVSDGAWVLDVFDHEFRLARDASSVPPPDAGAPRDASAPRDAGAPDASPDPRLPGEAPR